jgi:uncharacterized protein involved in outer membrane biogenesis
MKWLTRTALVLLILVAIVAVVPFFVSLNDYVPQVEKELSAQLKAPVSIDTLHASFVPVPHLRVEGIAIGSAEEIKAAKITLNPDLWSLLTSTKVIRSAEFENVNLTQAALSVLVDLAQQDRGPGGGIRIETVKLKTAIVKFEQTSFGPFDAEVELASGAQQGNISLKTQDGALQARVIPTSGRYAFEAFAKGWTPPLGPPIRFEALQLKGVATMDAAEFSELDAKLYGGTISGKAKVSWDDGVKLAGQFDVHQVELKDAAALVSPKTRVSGKLDAKPVFSAHARSVAQLDEALRLETPFTVHNGVLYGLDLPGAVSALTRQGQSGGQTQFEQLTGRLTTERGGYRLTQLRIASGALAARGNVTIGANKSLSGQFTASVSGAGAAANVPLVVAGTLETPMVYPNATALLGAAANAVGGTASIGQGLGGAAGGALGGIAEGLLGKKKR